MIRESILVALIFLVVAAIAQPVGSQTHTEYSILAIEYIGPHDKPVPPIVISDSKAGAEWYRDSVLKGDEYRLISVHVVPVSLMADLVADADASRHVAQQEAGKASQSLKIVSIAVVVPQGRGEFQLDRESALLLLDSLKKSCRHEKPLYSTLVDFRKRL